MFNRSIPSLHVSRAKFIAAIAGCESAERRVGRLSSEAREGLERIVSGAGLTTIYLWSAGETPRFAALCLDPTGRFFTVEAAKVEPVTVAAGWAFILSCREWADNREVKDRDAACRWESAVLAQLQSAEAKSCPLSRAA